MVDVGGVLARLMLRLTCLAVGEVYWDQTFLTQSVGILQALRVFPFTGCFFLIGTPPKSSKYKKVNLG